MIIRLLLVILIWASPVWAVTLAWDTVTTYNDGTPLIDPAAYDMHYGLATGAYNTSLDAGMSTSISIAGLIPGDTYYFAATARSGGQNSSYSNEVSFTEPLPPGDTTPPVVAITSPADGASVARKSTVTIQASASDNVGVDHVDIYVGGVLQCTASAAPYTCQWQVPPSAHKSYQIGALAYDAAGNAGLASMITVRSN